MKNKNDLISTIEGKDGISSLFSLISIRRRLRINPTPKIYHILYTSLMLAQVSLMIYTFWSPLYAPERQLIRDELEEGKKYRNEIDMIKKQVILLKDKMKTTSAGERLKIAKLLKDKEKRLEALISKIETVIKTIENIERDIAQRKKENFYIQVITISLFIAFSTVGIYLKRRIKAIET